MIRRFNRSIVVSLRAALIVVTAIAGLTVCAQPAMAHAQLASTEPAEAAILDAAPDRIKLHFEEPVRTVLDGVRVYDQDGRRIDTKKASLVKGDDTTVEMSLGNLRNGGYVVVWRVVSADSHPVRGVFTFQVGNDAQDVRVLSKSLFADTGQNVAVTTASRVVRLVDFLALAILAGGLLCSAWVFRRVQPRSNKILAVALCVAVGADLIGFGLQGVKVTGRGFGELLDLAVVDAVFQTGYGVNAAARWVSLALLGVVMLLSRRGVITAGTKLWNALVSVLSVAALATITLSGHAVSGRWVPLAIPLDLVHLTAMSIWFGGLIALLVGVLRRSSDSTETAQSDDGARDVKRFSAVAFWSVIAIAVTGTLQGLRQVGSLGNLTGSDYGFKLLVKVILFIGLVVLASKARNYVKSHKMSATGSDSSGKELRFMVKVEAGLAVLILAVTSVLVDAAPPRLQSGEPFSTNLQVGDAWVQLLVDPARRGPNQVHIYTLTQEGQVYEVPEATVTMDLPSKGIEGLPVPMQVGGPGHYVAQAFPIPLSGNWTFHVKVRTTDVDVSEASTQVRIS